MPGLVRRPELACQLHLALLALAVHVPGQEQLLALLVVEVQLQLRRQELALPLRPPQGSVSISVH